MKEFEPKTILITGCSSGFGLLIAARLAEKKHNVIATMRDLAKSGPLKEEVKRRRGKVDIMQLDVTDDESIKNAVTEIGNKYGYVDVLVNNAGYGIGGFFEDLTEAEIRQQMETNFFGVQKVTRAVIPFMRQKKSGKIVNISSISGLYSSPCFGAYSASKWALEAFSESLRYELKFFGIDVLLVEPGTYRTKIFTENARLARDFDDESSPYYHISQYMINRIRAHVEDCHKDPEDVAALVEKLVNKKNPPFRNIPDIESQIMYFIRRFLPFRVYSSIVHHAIFSKLKEPFGSKKR